MMEEFGFSLRLPLDSAQSTTGCQPVDWMRRTQQLSPFDELNS